MPGMPGGLPAPAARGARTPAAKPAAKHSDRGTSGSGLVAAAPRRPDPVGELRFKVGIELDGGEIGRFRECSGLAAEIEVKDYNEGGVNHFVHKLPTRMKYPNLVLKRGVTYEEALLQWLWITQRKAKRVAITVSLMGPAGEPVRAWSFADAFPVKWTGPTLNASSNQVATETLEIVHGGLTLTAMMKP
jgi:phage tail-like protein